MLKHVILGAMGLLGLGLVSACTAEVPQEEIGSTDEAATSCVNVEGVNAVLAALAASTAAELHRWQTATDFEMVNGQLALSATGKAQCANQNCWNTQVLLDLQKSTASGLIKFPGGVTLVPDAYSSRLAANWQRQVTCNTSPDNHSSSNCPVEQHYLKFDHKAVGVCDADFFYKATKTDKVTALQYPAQLKNQLITFGYNSGNTFLSFNSTGDLVSVDPTGGLDDGSTTTSGSAIVACQLTSATSVIGQACVCNNVNGVFQRSVLNANLYLCR